MPDLARPETSDVGVSVDMSSEGRFILNEINALQDVSTVDSCIGFTLMLSITHVVPPITVTISCI